MTQKPLIEFCVKHNISVTAYSPLGGGKLLTDKTLIRIGENHKKSAAQVMIKYQIQRGVSVIPRSISKERLKENLNVFDFNLTSDEINEIEKLNLDIRYNSEKSAKHHIYYPFNIPYYQ